MEVCSQPLYCTFAVEASVLPPSAWQIQCMQCWGGSQVDERVKAPCSATVAFFFARLFGRAASSLSVSAALASTSSSLAAAAGCLPLRRARCCAAACSGWDAFGAAPFCTKTHSQQDASQPECLQLCWAVLHQQPCRARKGMVQLLGSQFLLHSMHVASIQTLAA